MTETSVKVRATRWTAGGRSAVEESVLEETVLMEREFSLHINGRVACHQAFLPGGAHELAVGWLCSEGYIERAEDILDIEADEGTGSVSVRLAEPVTRREPGPLPPLEWDPETVMEHSRAFLARSELFRETGGVHSALMVRGPGALCFAEDLGRFNALDKCLGRALLMGTDPDRCMLFTSGRLPLGLVLKVIRAGIPMVVSRSAPTDAALEAASRCRLQVVGFARGDRMTLYGHDPVRDG